jgi:hypothetical protein
MAAPRATKTAGDAYTIVGLVMTADLPSDATLATFGVIELAITGLLLLAPTPVAAGWIATRLEVPLATVTAALARLTAASVSTTDPQEWIFS